MVMSVDPIQPDSTRDHSADFLSDEQMRAALGNGEAAPLSRLITDHVHYQGDWWCAFPGGWFRINDSELVTYLDNRRARTVDGLELGGPSSTQGV